MNDDAVIVVIVAVITLAMDAMDGDTTLLSKRVVILLFLCRDANETE